MINNYCRARFVKRNIDSNARLYMFFNESVAIHDVRDNPFFKQLESLTHGQNGAVSLERPDPSTFVLAFRKVAGDPPGGDRPEQHSQTAQDRKQTGTGEGPSLRLVK